MSLLLLLLPSPSILLFSALLLVVLSDALLDVGLEVAADRHWKLGQLEGIVLPFIFLSMFLNNFNDAFGLAWCEPVN